MAARDANHPQGASARLRQEAPGLVLGRSNLPDALRFWCRAGEWCVERVRERPTVRRVARVRVGGQVRDETFYLLGQAMPLIAVLETKIHVGP